MNIRFLIVIALTILAAPGAQADESQPAFTNEDVVKMVSAGLGDELVIAKISQVDQAEFRVDVDDIIELKSAGVNEQVIKAMVEHRDDSIFDASGRSSAATPAPAVVSAFGPMGEDLGYETIRVALETEEEGQQLLRVQRGEFSTTAMGMMAFIDYPGLTARVRTKNRRPALLVKSKSPLTGGRYFFAKLDSDTDDGVRSLKVSSAKGRFKGMFGNSRKMTEPDHDWVLPYSVEDQGDDLWKVTLDQDLEPGEYGWYVDIGAGLQQSTIFDFGVD